MAKKVDKRIDVLLTLSKCEDFEEWGHDIEIWQAVTELEEKKQGPVLYRSLEGQAKKVCSNIAVKDICDKDGFKLIIQKLENVFVEDAEQMAFEDCMAFETFTRSPEMSIVEYITEFERLYNRIQVHDMKYADGVSAYRLLINANISEEKQSMCRTTTGKLTFGNIKKQLKVIHDCTGMDVATRTSNTSSVMVKKEHVLEAECSEYKSFYTGSNRPRRGWRGSRGSF